MRGMISSTGVFVLFIRLLYLDSLKRGQPHASAVYLSWTQNILNKITPRRN